MEKKYEMNNHIEQILLTQRKQTGKIYGSTKDTANVIYNIDRLKPYVCVYARCVSGV